jgi:hypothetical protein
MSLTRVSLISIFFLFASTLTYAQTYKVVATSAPPAGAVPPAVASALEPHGMKFENAQAQVVADVWFAKSLPATANPSTSPVVLYGSLATGTFVGVLRFPNQGSDYRGQTIKAGYYTLRYEWIPEDGNHMGVSQYRDFLLLLPEAKDTHPAQVMGFHEVVKLSRLATGTGHPGVLMMDRPRTSLKSLPAAFQDSSQNWGLQADANISGKTTPLAFVLVGQYQGG